MDASPVFSVVCQGADHTALLERLAADDVLGQLLERSGTMAELATEADDVKLDWVDQLGLALERPESLEAVARLAERLLESGVTQLLWSGMGGSVQAVRCLERLGWLSTPGLEIVPLDTTDPRALDRFAGDLSGERLLHTGIVAVSMGMTSEEPIAHLSWFDSVAEAAGVTDRHRRELVMTLPGSYLDTYATEHGITSVPLQLDGQNHIAGRMSAPSTRVFLLPVALTLSSSEALLEVVRRCQAGFRLGPGLGAAERRALTGSDPFIALGAWLGAQLADGRDMVVVDCDETCTSFVPWIEQLVEESLCKSGKGLLVFVDQALSAGSRTERLVRLSLRAGPGASPELPREKSPGSYDASPAPVAGVAPGPWTAVPEAALTFSWHTDDPVARLAAAGRMFAGWSLAVATIGYLAGLVFAGQPGVESYKRYARELRDAPGPLPFPSDDLVPLEAARDGRGETRAGAGGASTRSSGVLWLGALEEDLQSETKRALDTLATPVANEPAGAGSFLAAVVSALSSRQTLGYLDLTINGDPEGPSWDRLSQAMRRLANEILGIPLKVRSGPRDYHSTEQSQIDGPPELLSLRVGVRQLPKVRAGTYDNRFFQAQTLGTVLAMRDAKRPVLLALLDDDGAVDALVGAIDEAAELLTRS